MLWLAQQQLKSKSPKARRQAIQKLRRAGDPSAVEPLILVLRKDREAEIRKEAAEALGDLKDSRTVQPLLEALKDPADSVKEAAIDALRLKADTSAFGPLLAVLELPNGSLRAHAAQTLKALGWQPREDRLGAIFMTAVGEMDRAALLGSVAVEPLSAALKDSAYQKRVTAVNRLAEIGDPAAVPALLSALQDPDALVRTAAANALGTLGDPQAIPLLTGCLQDGEPKVRAAAAGALGALGAPAAVDGLIAALQDAHWEVRATALEALGRMRDPRAAEPIVASLADPDKEVRQAAADAAGNLGAAGAAAALVVCLVDAESSVRQAAARALQKVEPYWERSAACRPAIPLLQAALKHKEHAVQFAAAEVLRRIGEHAPGAASDEAGTSTDLRKTAVAIFKELLSDPDPDLRQAAAESLGRIGDRRAAEQLRSALEDTSPWVRTAAEKALETLR